MQSQTKPVDERIAAAPSTLANESAHADETKLDRLLRALCSWGKAEDMGATPYERAMNLRYVRRVMAEKIAHRLERGAPVTWVFSALGQRHGSYPSPRFDHSVSLTGLRYPGILLHSEWADFDLKNRLPIRAGMVILGSYYAPKCPARVGLLFARPLDCDRFEYVDARGIVVAPWSVTIIGAMLAHSFESKGDFAGRASSNGLRFKTPAAGSKVKSVWERAL